MCRECIFVVDGLYDYTCNIILAHPSSAPLGISIRPYVPAFVIDVSSPKLFVKPSPLVPSFSEPEEGYDFSWLFGEDKEGVDIKVMVPNGMIFGVGKDDEIVWQHKV